MKIFHRKFFHDGNFEICPNPSKSIASNSELALIPFFCMFYCFYEVYTCLFLKSDKIQLFSIQKISLPQWWCNISKFPEPNFFPVWQKFYLIFLLLKTLLACADRNIWNPEQNQWFGRGVGVITSQSSILFYFKVFVSICCHKTLKYETICSPRVSRLMFNTFLTFSSTIFFFDA